jgi:hypothetical protein
LNHIGAMLRLHYCNIHNKINMDGKKIVKKESAEDKLNYNLDGGTLEIYRLMKKTYLKH